MINIGQFNTLKVVKQVEFGVYLDGGERGEILLPRRYVPPTTQLNDALDVFIYFDSDDCLIATTEKAQNTLRSMCIINRKDVNRVGAFMDWGLMKDLLVPYAEQHKPFEVGQNM